ncbi:MAG TPA: hypothetical protein VER04_25565 [Polyangiaceae bacterium]|nr:hypothetical protein [Polyangiaceae bacterium]
MLRRIKSSWLVLAGWLVSACLFGGQTGEPASLDCTTSAAPWRVSVNGVSPEQLALAYQGQHRVKLHWSKDPIAIAEAVTLTLDYREQSGTIDSCSGPLRMSVDFSLQANDGTLIDSGQGSLSAARGTLHPAAFSGSGQHFRIVGNFSQEAGALIVRGTLEPRVDAATGDSADFSSDSNGLAGAGGI